MSKQVSIFYGEEDYLIEQEIGRRKARLADQTVAVEVLDGRTATIEQIVAAFQTASMFVSEKLVIVYDFNAEGEAAEGLSGYLKNIPSGVEVIFVNQSVDKRKKFYRLVNEIGQVMEFKPFSDWEQEKLLDWIIGCVHQEKKKIASHGTRLLMEIAGKNLRALRSEINKLVTYIGDRDTIQEKDVLMLASSGEISSFSLMNAVREKDLAAALSAYRIFIRNRQQPEVLLGGIASQIRMLLQVKSLEGMGLTALTGRLGSNPNFVRISLDAAGNFSLEELKEDIRLLNRASLSLKTNSSKDAVMEVLLVDLCRRS